MTALANRYDFVLLFDVSNGNPNGDPDAGNLPRLDPETNHGLVSDVCLKRKIRNYVELAKGGAGRLRHLCPGRRDPQRAAPQGLYRAMRPGDAKVAKDAKLNPKDDDEANAAARLHVRRISSTCAPSAPSCRPASTAARCAGPVQMTFASSIEPIVPLEISITRMAATNEAEKKQRAEGSEEGNERTDNRTMGRKHIVPYGLYRAHGFISAKLAERTGFSEADLDLLFEALGTMFEHDRSAARGEMATRKLIVFKHANALGNAPAHALFERVKVGRNIDGEFREIDATARQLSAGPEVRRLRGRHRPRRTARWCRDHRAAVRRRDGSGCSQPTSGRHRSRSRRSSTPSTACGRPR